METPEHAVGSYIHSIETAIDGLAEIARTDPNSYLLLQQEAERLFAASCRLSILWGDLTELRAA